MDLNKLFATLVFRHLAVGYSVTWTAVQASACNSPYLLTEGSISHKSARGKSQKRQK